MNILENLRDNSAWLIFIAVFLVNIVLGAIRKAGNKGQASSGKIKRQQSLPSHSSNAMFPQGDNLQKSKSDMFPTGDSLRKTSKNAMFRH